MIPSIGGWVLVADDASGVTVAGIQDVTPAADIITYPRYGTYTQLATSSDTRQNIFLPFKMNNPAANAHFRESASRFPSFGERFGGC